MNKTNDIRIQLKRALVDLEAARDQRQSGTTQADTRMIEMRIRTRSDAFTRLMEKLISQQTPEVALSR